MDQGDGDFQVQRGDKSWLLMITILLVRVVQARGQRETIYLNIYIISDNFIVHIHLTLLNIILDSYRCHFIHYMSIASVLYQIMSPAIHIHFKAMKPNLPPTLNNLLISRHDEDVLSLIATLCNQKILVF